MLNVTTLRSSSQISSRLNTRGVGLRTYERLTRLERNMPPPLGYLDIRYYANISNIHLIMLSLVVEIIVK